MSMIETNGIKLFYEITGNGEHPIVFVHGSWVNHHSWDFVAPLLSSRFQMLTYDRRGHSKSERLEGQGKTADDVSDLASLMEQTGFAPAHVVGNSFGGSIVLKL